MQQKMAQSMLSENGQIPSIRNVKGAYSDTAGRKPSSSVGALVTHFKDQGVGQGVR